MHAHVSVERDDIALDGPVNVEIATSDGDRTFNDRLRGDGPVAKREVVSVWQPPVSFISPLLDFFGNLTGVSGRNLRRLD